jgi:hypothetical protein
MGQRNRKLHLENWHSVVGGLDGFEHLSTACPLSQYFQPSVQDVVLFQIRRDAEALASIATALPQIWR